MGWAHLERHVAKVVCGGVEADGHLARQGLALAIMAGVRRQIAVTEGLDRVPRDVHLVVLERVPARPARPGSVGNCCLVLYLQTFQSPA